MNTLYDIVGEAKELYEKMMDLGLDDEAIRDTIEAETDIVPKGQSYGFVIKNMEAMESAIKEEVKRLSERAKTIEKRRKQVENRLLEAMIATGIKKIEHPQFTLTVRQNPISVSIFDERQIPPSYMVKPEPIPRPDKKAIKAAIESGKDVPGAMLERRQSLKIS